MNEVIIETGYHATTTNNANTILATEFKKSISTNNKKHWLGNGVYFFTDIYWAVQWNIYELKKYINRNKNIEDFTVLTSKIVCNDDIMIDLSSGEGKEIFFYMQRCLRNKLQEEGKIELIEEVSRKSKKFLINLLEDYGFFDDFAVIKAIYIDQKEKDRVKKADDFIMNVQCQICVKDITYIKDTKEYSSKNKLHEIYLRLKEEEVWKK